MANIYPQRLVLGIDARDGMVATHGWLETSSTSAIALAQQIAAKSKHLAAIVYTDIAKDGMLTGPNFEQLKQMQAATSIPVVCSGGVTSMEDIEQLLQMNCHAAIVGRAIYDGKLDLTAVLKRCPQ
jgi:phosphoribosylformimino-5-aminoimidazole carboxamide ribotide isomerase